MAIKRQKTEYIDTGLISVAVGETKTLYDRTLPKKHRRYITNIKFQAPDGDVNLTLNDGDTDINPDAKNVEAFPQSLNHPYNLGWGSTLRVTCNHGLSRTIQVRAIIKCIREIEE